MMNDRITVADNSFDNLRALLAATTPGDWRIIVAAHNELPALLARLDEVTAEKDALAAVVAEVNNWSISYDVTESELFDILDKSPSSVLAAHDAKVRAEALREAREATFRSLDKAFGPIITHKEEKR